MLRKIFAALRTKPAHRDNRVTLKKTLPQVWLWGDTGAMLSDAADGFQASAGKTEPVDTAFLWPEFMRLTCCNRGPGSGIGRTQPCGGERCFSNEGFLLHEVENVFTRQKLLQRVHFSRKLFPDIIVLNTSLAQDCCHSPGVFVNGTKISSSSSSSVSLLAKQFIVSLL